MLHWPARGSVSDLFEAIVSFMVAPIDEDRTVTDPVAMRGPGQERGRRNGRGTRALPVVITLHTVGAKARGIGNDALPVTVLALAELDVVNTDAPNEVEGAAPPVSGKLSAALFFSNFQVGGIGQ